jgi:DNA-binding response OmpR family regulator/signal transduction histidine kinase
MTSTILIVDDEPTSRQALESLLMNQGYRLVFAGTGKDALEQASQHTPDLILLDVMMPGMDGFEVCRKLRATPSLREVPIVLVTSLDDRDARLEGIEAGADEFISKPFDRVELRTRVRTITRLNRYRRIQEERVRFKWVVEHANDGFVIVDSQGLVRYANRQARHYLDLPDAPPDEDENEVLAPEPFLLLAKKRYRCEPEIAWQRWNDGQGDGQESGEPAQSGQQLPEQGEEGETEAEEGEEGKGETFVRYLVWPETATSSALWLKVDSLDLPQESQEGQIIRLRDVTEHMLNLRQVWTFHSLISHKFGTPLTCLISSLHLLKTSKTLSQEEQEFVEISFESAQSLHNQIQNVRQYLNTPGLALPGEECQVGRIPSLIERIRTETSLHALALTGVDALADTYVALSEQSIDLILREVVGNAVKFHPTKTPTVEVAVTAPNGQDVHIVVSDDGITLTPEQLAQVWVPYYQAEKKFSGQIPGMGLGLAMVASLLWNVGGHYLMTNRTPGPGVVVDLSIPRARDNLDDPGSDLLGPDLDEIAG